MDIIIDDTAQSSYYDYVMHILSRSEATARGLKKYFTGKPCRNNHLAERYTQSGTCEQCINGRRLEDEPVIDERQRQRLDAAEKREGVKEARQRLTRVKFIVPHRFIGKLRDYAFLLASLRDPRVAYEDIALMQLASFSTGNFMARYTISVHPEDYETVAAYSEELKAAGFIPRIQVEPNGEAEAIRRLEEMSTHRFPEGDPR